MADIKNIGVPQVANRAFVALAVQAGIEATIESLVTLAMDKRALLIALKEALWEDNQPLAEALNIETLDAIVAYMERRGTGIVFANKLPDLLDEDGPASVSAARDAGTKTQVNVTFSEPPVGHTYEIYLDGVFQKAGEVAASGGWVNDAVADIVDDKEERVVRVLFVDVDGNMTRFGPIAKFL